ncbi:hypothetical protein EDC48_12711 [Gibbsiella quercinecans]|nr:hypothetical protein EDC48_12711 [Gibbsiella quercinecans]
MKQKKVWPISEYVTVIFCTAVVLRFLQIWFTT